MRVACNTIGGVINHSPRIADSDLIDETNLGVYWYNPATGSYERVVPYVQDTVANTLTVQVSHFSVYAMIRLLDTNPPTVGVIMNPLPNAAGWLKTDVTITFTCSDAESGIATCPSPKTISTEGQVITGTATDKAGNSATTSVTVSLDKAPPMLSMPNLTSTYLYGYPLPFNFSTSDLLSGVINMAATLNGGPISNGNVVTLNKLGINTFTLSASDRAGNTSSQTTTFNVVYNFSGVLQPINSDGSSIFKLGSTVPVKFQLRDANGVYVSTAVAKIYLAKVTDGVTGTELEAISTSSADTGNTFRYDSSGNQYIFNLGSKSLSAGTWRIRIDLGDGTLNTVLISLKK